MPLSIFLQSGEFFLNLAWIFGWPWGICLVCPNG